MSYVQRNSALWFNLAGVVAAWQPVRAPGPLMARYNQANGGTGRYLVTNGTAPVFRSANGWTFNGSSQFLRTNYYPVVGANLSVFVRAYQNTVTENTFTVVGMHATSSPYSGVFVRLVNKESVYGALYANDGVSAKAIKSSFGSHVAGVSGRMGYLDGIADSAAWADDTQAFPAYDLYIGAMHYSSTIQHFPGSVQAIVIVERVLSPAEIWTISRQMAYCDVNQDWSTWGRRRKWYFPAVTGSVGIYGKRHDVALTGGVRIQAIDEAVNL